MWVSAAAVSDSQCESIREGSQGPPHLSSSDVRSPLAAFCPLLLLTSTVICQSWDLACWLQPPSRRHYREVLALRQHTRLTPGRPKGELLKEGL